jgi:hypothetical protein
MRSYGSTLTSAGESDTENNDCKERTHCERESSEDLPAMNVEMKMVVKSQQPLE